MDPASIFGIIGGAIQITQIITSTVQGLATLRGKFADADLTIRLLISELSTIKSAIAQLHDWAEYNSEGSPKNKEYIHGLDVALDGVQAVMDILSEEVASMTKGFTSEVLPTLQLGFKAKVRVVWNEDLMRDHHQRLHSQVLALQLLLQACQCRSSTEQADLLRMKENKRLIQKVVDDTMTLRTAKSAANSRRTGSLLSNQSSIGDTIFDFDDELVDAVVYRRALSHNRSKLDNSKPEDQTEDGVVVMVKRQESNATVGTDEGYASGATGTRTPDLSLSAYLDPIRSEHSLGTRPYETLQTEQAANLSRSRTAPYGQTSSESKSSVRRWRSVATGPLQTSSGSTKDKLRSALRRLNTSSSTNLRLTPSPKLSVSPTGGLIKQRKSRESDFNISIDLSSMDSITAPPIVKAAQSGSKKQVEILIANGADIESCHLSTGRNALAVAAHCGKEDIVGILIQNNARLDVRDTTMSTPLHLAASRGHSGVLDLLLVENVEVDARDANGRTPLWLAASGGHVEATQILLYNQCKINARAVGHMTALHTAAKRGDAEMTGLLLRHGVDIEAKDIHMMAALHHACEGGHTLVAELLLNSRANIEAAGANRTTPLICAAASGRLQTTQFLIKRRASVRSTDEHAMNALHWAAFNGHTEIVDLLLRKRVSVQSTNEQGRTALHLAAMNKQFAVVEFLLRKQAPTDGRCRQGFTPLHYACDANNIELARVLLASGADLEAPIEGNLRRPIHIAASLGSSELLKLLLEKGVVIDSADSAGNRALCIACSYGHVHIVKQLLDAGALPRLKAGDQTFEDSPLCLAAKAGHVAVVALLLESGAPTNQTDEMGWDPLLYAAHYGHPKVLEMLMWRSPLVPESFSSFNEVGFASHVPISKGNKEKVKSLISQRNLGTGHTTPWRSPSPWSSNNHPGPVQSGDVSFRSTPQPRLDHILAAPFHGRPEGTFLPPQELPSTFEQDLPGRRSRGPEKLDFRRQPIAAVDRVIAPEPVASTAPALALDPEGYPSLSLHHSSALKSLSSSSPSSSSSSSSLDRENKHVHREARLTEEGQDSNVEPTFGPDRLPFYPFDPSSYDARSVEPENGDRGVSDADSITSVYTALEMIEEEVEINEIYELPG